MPISPMYVGQTGLPAVFIVVDDTDTPINLTGATLFVLTISDPVRQVRRSGAGTFTLTNPTAGQVTYAWNAADTAIVGQYTLALSFFFESTNVVCDPIQWTVSDL